MISHFSYNNSMDSIQSFRAALDYKKEAIDIPLDTLVTALPDEIVSLIKPQNFGVGIFTMDRILPEKWVNAKDEFFIKDIDGKSILTKPQPGMDPDKVFYKPHLDIVTGQERILPLTAYFGKFVTLARTRHACQRALSIHALELYLLSLGLYEVYQDVQLPSLATLVPGLSYDNWKDHKTADVLSRMTEVVPGEELVDEQEYDVDVLKALGVRMSPLVKLFSEFYEYDRDCYYRLEIRHSHVRLIKGIDHKYLPYYEQKFGATP